jgi:hypothetical protein
MDSLDLDAALARTYQRHDQLVRQAVRRRHRTIGVALVAVAAAVAIVVPLTLGSDTDGHVSPPVVAGQPSSTTTVDPNAEPLVPAGFALSDVGAIRTLTLTAQPPDDATAAPGVGASSAATERARLVSSSHGPWLRSVTVRFNCIRLPEQLSQVRYTVTPNALVVDASLTYTPDAKPCPSPKQGPVITLPLVEPLPASLPVVAGSVPSH